MPIINLDGFDTQLDPMGAVCAVLKDWEDGFLSGIEALRIVNAVATEWRQ